NTRSRRRSRTAAYCRIAAETFTPELSKQSKRFITIASTSKSSYSPITLSVASCVRRQWTTSEKQDARQPHGQRRWTPGAGLSRLSAHLRHYQRPSPHLRRALRSVSSCGRCWPCSVTSGG